ncbi:MAG TPA: thiamine phosphate synthase [Candidatus Dormibacteraeota bacterium]|nr:thiamine phosphate synthase [Candidatus Dormibacteraeota bacterium]
MRLRHGPESVSRQASRNPQLARAGLYVITPDAPAERVLEVAAAAVRGGADIVQLRHKSMPRGELLELAKRLRASIEGALFVVNDYVDIALLSEADGVHLGPDDLSIASARRVAGDRLLIGASASTPERAHQAVAQGADYLGCGPAFATPIKAEKRVIGPEGIAAIARRVDVPVFAIGGIDASNLPQLTAAGLHRVCVLRAVGDAPDPEEATRELRAMLSPR